MPLRRPHSIRRLFRFRLRTLLLLMVVFSVACAYLGRDVVRQAIEQPVVAQIVAAGGSVRYDYQFRQTTNGRHFVDFSAEPPGPPWLLAIFGDDLFATVHSVSLASSAEEEVALSDLGKLSSVRVVKLQGSGFTDKCIDHLRDARRIEQLSLSEVNLSGSGFARLASLAELRAITLLGSNASDKYLAELHLFSELDHLAIVTGKATDAGMLGVGKLRKLRTLELVRLPSVTDKGIAALSQLKQLQNLQLVEVGVTDDALATIGSFEHLQYLNMYGLPITDKGAEHLARLSALETLVICYTGIADDGILSFAGSQGLKSLDIRGTKITDTACDAIKKFADLGYLAISETQITDAGLLELTALSELLHLKVSVNNGGVTLGGLRQFQAAMPSCTIECYEHYPDGTAQWINIQTGEARLD